MSPVGSPGRNDAVLLRCRETIERLHAELEEERHQRSELRKQLAAVESDLQVARSDVEREQGVRADVEARAARLERQIADYEAKLQTQKKNCEALSDQLQKAKVDAVQKAQELFAKGLRATELEGAVRRAETQAGTAHAESSRFEKDARDANERIAALEAEATQLRSTVDVEGSKGQRANRLADERERRCDELQREIDEIQATARVTEETLRQQLAESRKQYERAAANWREREAEHSRILTERVAEAESSSSVKMAEASDLQLRLSDSEATSGKQERRTEQLQAEIVALRRESEAKMQAAQTDHGREYSKALEDLASRDAQVISLRAEIEATQQQSARLEEERRALQEKWFSLSADSSKLHQQVEHYQLQLADKQKQIVERGEEMHKIEGRQSAAMTKCELQARAEVTEMHDRAEAEIHRAALELTEQRGRYSALEERHAELLRNSRTSTEGCAEFQSQVKELTWRMEATNGELEKSRASLHAEQERSRRAEALVQQLRDSVKQKEEDFRRSAEKVEQVSRRDLDDSHRMQEQFQRNADEVRQAREQVSERSDMLKQRDELIRQREEQLRHSELEVERVSAEARRAHAALADGKRRSEEDFQLQADLRAANMSSDMKRDAAELRHEAMEAVARSAATQADAQARITVAETECQARTEQLTRQLAEANMKLCRMEAEARVALHSAETTNVLKGREVEAFAERRLEKAEKKAIERAEMRMEQRAEERIEQKTEKLRRKYEDKMKSMCSRLADREAYEHHLKALIQNEVDVLHQYNRELDTHGQRLHQFEKEAVQDVVSNRMRGLADKVEKRVLRSLRHSSPGCGAMTDRCRH